jgi:hypothetical protein
MVRSVRGAAASLARGLIRCRDLVRRIFGAMRRAHDREAAQEIESLLGISGQKFTDELERKMMERLTRNRNFRR